MTTIHLTVISYEIRNKTSNYYYGRVRAHTKVKKPQPRSIRGVEKAEKAFLGPRLSELTKSARAAPDATGAPQ